MCGIAGIVKLDGSTADLKQFSHAMNTIRHRGPDDEGAVIIETPTGRFEERGGKDTLPQLELTKLQAPTDLKVDLIMANRRLAIIDLTPSGHQPQHNEDHNIWLVFNGEVYNFRELREELTAAGHRFSSNTDTEVVIHGYEEWGIERLLSKMIGMWGFALWDQCRKKLYLVRDRFGIKPLYYHKDNAMLIFGSEIKFIRTLFKTKINEKRVSEFLWFLPYDPKETFFEDVNQVLPSHYMELDLSSKKMEEMKYWDIKDVNRSYRDLEDYEAAIKEFYDHLERSVKYHMISDVPVGTCLSGGLDSSTIVCLAQKLLVEGKISEKGLTGVKRLKTFSSIPKEERISEAFYIECVVNESGVEGYSVTPTLEDFLRDFEKILLIHDEPFQNPSVYMQFRVMELAKKNGVKVLLDGQGADELLGGYHSYLKLYIKDLMKESPIKFLKEGFKIRDIAMPLMWRYVRNKIGLRKSFMREILKVKSQRSPRTNNKSFTDVLRYDLLQGGLLELLKYEDINSMAFSIESRVPFLYHPLAEYLFKQPMSLRIKDGWTKFVLREAMKGILPEEVRLRRSKLGFPAPDVEWAKRLIQENPSWCMSLMKYSEGYVNSEGFLKLCRRIVTMGWQEDVLLFWRIIILSKWLALFRGEDQ
jgi:asparagine synthase (glutamine-hydrolysing)